MAIQVHVCPKCGNADLQPKFQVMKGVYFECLECGNKFDDVSMIQLNDLSAPDFWKEVAKVVKEVFDTAKASGNEWNDEDAEKIMEAGMKEFVKNNEDGLLDLDCENCSETDCPSHPDHVPPDVSDLPLPSELDPNKN